MSARYIPSSYCPGMYAQQAAQLNAVEEAPAPSPAPKTAIPVAASKLQQQQPAPQPPKPAVEPTPVYSSYARGAVLPAAYYLDYNQPMMAPPPTPATQHIPTPYPQSVPEHQHDDANCPYKQYSPAVTPVAARPVEQQHNVPIKREPAPFAYEPSAYAFQQLEENYARAPAAAPVGPKKSLYAPPGERQQPLITGPVATPSAQSTMETTQLPSAQMARAQAVQQPVIAEQENRDEANQKVHFAAPPPQQHVAPARPAFRPALGMSTYVGGVPNDMIAAYHTGMVPAYYQQAARDATSNYHFGNYQPNVIDSAVTAEIQEAEAAAMAAAQQVQQQQAPVFNMATMGQAVNDIQAQVGGRAFAPLNMPPCSEYQFDQLQDMASCN
ncbi:unnamed protein product, partial [Mesorhabditis spiculigera]